MPMCHDGPMFKNMQIHLPRTAFTSWHQLAMCPGLPLDRISDQRSVLASSSPSSRSRSCTTAPTAHEHPIDDASLTLKPSSKFWRVPTRDFRQACEHHANVYDLQAGEPVARKMPCNQSPKRSNGLQKLARHVARRNETSDRHMKTGLSNVSLTPTT